MQAQRRLLQVRQLNSWQGGGEHLGLWARGSINIAAKGK